MNGHKLKFLKEYLFTSIAISTMLINKSLEKSTIGTAMPAHISEFALVDLQDSGKAKDWKVTVAAHAILTYV